MPQAGWWANAATLDVLGAKVQKVWEKATFINILYLVITDLLDIPILYLSRYITHNKGKYYALLQAIRDKNNDNAKEWEDWIVFMLKGIEETATDTIELVKGISLLMAEYKTILRPLFDKAYKHELINNLFFHPLH